MLKLPRTIRLDPSDTFVFERAADPGEWAVSGAFVFWNRDLANLAQKQRVALRSGFLGVDSLGWSTLAIVTEATEADRQAMVERLAGQLLEQFGAPDLAAARPAAEEEVAFAASICDPPLQTLLAVQRNVENGEIRELAHFSAGIRPKSKPETSATATPKPRERASSEISSSRGRLAGPIHLSVARAA